MTDKREDRKQLLENRKMIRKQIASLITGYGFKRRGRSVFCQIIGENAVFFHIDHPTNTFYLAYGAYPLYMPPMHIHFFCEAMRLSVSMNDFAMDLADDATKEEVDVWCAKADAFLRDRLMPFFHQTSSAEGMACCLRAKEKDAEDKEYTPLGRLSVLTFRPPQEPLMYVELAAHAFDRAVEAVHACLAEIEARASRRPLNEAYRRSMEAKTRQVLELAEMADPQAVDAILNGWRKQNAAMINHRRRLLPDEKA
ncbi:MAG: hypothetical protein IKP40_00425 [Clostridia bacterium]|nr:hypothetical protein [Clostridia bacterium]